jgi:protein-S-isoprenylcysteine O-methyltransferase Ste14
MGLDLRLPVGLMFSLVGLLLAGYGLATGSNAEMYKRSLGINVNIRWGLVLVVFGALMLLAAWRTAKKKDTP